MSPSDRKATSVQHLQALNVPSNEHLPVIEADADVTLRNETELAQRLVALWAVVGTAILRGNSQFRDYIVQFKYESWLSNDEREFMFAGEPTQEQLIQFSWQLEALYFLSWCAGLVPELEVPSRESSVESILHLFPQPSEPPTRLRHAIRLRSKAEILDWSDLIYRLNWAVRDARLNNTTPPPGVNGGVVEEWHRAVNWMTRYDGEDDWDHVGTDT